MARRKSVAGTRQSGATAAAAKPADDLAGARLSFRVKEGREWRGIPLAAFRGLRSEDAWLVLDGLDCVAEYTVDGVAKGYVCGTQRWVDYYRARGYKAFSFPEAVEQIRQRQPAMLEAVCPDETDRVEAVFAGSRLEYVRELPLKVPQNEQNTP
ncbi:MAG: hypothetical protein P1P84_02530 [Deferrisomatales bacterium]|nr:hypothetical protein [Deferrisomatales bacterium]